MKYDEIGQCSYLKWDPCERWIKMEKHGGTWDMERAAGINEA